ncbi:MAG: LysR family transcriptional regulator [Rhodospirillales bacterium]
MDWDKLRIFHAVAKAGSFTRAGESLNLSQSAVSRQISALEENLGVPLFHRHARGLIMTEQGELLNRTARDVANRLNQTVAQMSDFSESPQGPLRITTTVAFGSVWLTTRLHKFLRQYPEVEVSLVFADSELDLAMREADLAIRMAPPSQPDLIRRRLLSMQYHVYAAPSYLEEYGAPKTVQDLKNHRIVAYGERPNRYTANLNWLLEASMDADANPSVLRVNSAYGIFRAVQSGLCLGGLPDYFAITSPDLVRILIDLPGPQYDIFFVYPEELRHSKRIGVFRDFLINEINDDGLKTA